MPKKSNITFKPHGLTDAVDGTNAMPGSMKTLTNLVCNPTTPNTFVCRPAAAVTVDMASKFTTPTNITAATLVGTKVYGWCSSSDYAGKDVPFVYDLANSAFLNISGLKSSLLPASAPATGDWTPPTVTVFSTSCVIFTHPGFGTGVFGWLDTSSLTISSLTGTYNSGVTVLPVSADPNAAGVEPGMTITGTGIPAGTYVVSTKNTATGGSNSITISAATTASGTTAALTIAGGTLTAPLWGAGTTNTNGLVATPQAFTQFNGRGWFAVGNGLVYTDANRPRQVTNASQALILGDSVNVTALAGTPFDTPLTGGMVNALIAFKGAEPVWQVTGDAATSNLASSQIEGSVGTLAPLTITPTPQGLRYVAIDGVRTIDQNGHCSDPLGENGDGVRNPFANTPYPSRMCAAFWHNVMRIGLQDATLQGSPWVEYWFDFSRDAWTGPHTNAAQLLCAYPASSSVDFVFVPQGNPTQLWQGAVYPKASSSFVENGSQLSWDFQTSLQPDDGQMAMHALLLTTVALNVTTNQLVSITAKDEAGSPLGTAGIQGAGAASVWGSMNWGSGSWAGQPSLKQYEVLWTAPVEFKQMSLEFMGQSNANLVIGNVYGQYETLNYLLDPGVQL